MYLYQLTNNTTKTNHKTNKRVHRLKTLLGKTMANFICFALLLTSQTAHADFRKAIEAYQKRDGATMLKEVQDAVDKKNDDGIILFLGVLKQFNGWRPLLNDAQQRVLFNLLEQSAKNCSLEAQYRLAIITRKINNPPPILVGNELDQTSWHEARKQEKLQEHQDEIKRLESVAIKGYAPAATALYGNYTHNLDGADLNQDVATKWLKKSAELGSVQGAFMLGMKYLNVVDDAYGCYSYKPNQCLPKDEAKGWYWMQQAAMHANERNVMLGDFAYEMGNLYYQGVAGNKPDYEQAYRWYILAIAGMSIDSTTNYGTSNSLDHKVVNKIKNMEDLGYLANINRQLINQALKDSAFIGDEKKLRPPKIFGIKNKALKKPIYSQYEANGSAKLIDVYADGSVNFSYLVLPTDLNNDETVKKIPSSKINDFLKKIHEIGVNKMPIANYEPYSDEILLRSIYQISIRNKLDDKYIFRYNNGSNYAPVLDANLKKILSIVESFFTVSDLSCGFDSEEERNEKCKAYYKQLSEKQIN